MFQAIRIHVSCICTTWHIEARLDATVSATVSVVVSRDVEVHNMHIMNHFIYLSQV